MASFGRAVARVRRAAGAGRPPGREAELGTLGDFRLLREVGRGGMGIVYEAEQISLGRRVALKILPLAAALDPRQHQRFLLEARAAACLHHPHIVPVYAVGSRAGRPLLRHAVHRRLHAGRRCWIELDRGRDRRRQPPGAGARRPSCSLGTSSRDRGYIRAVAEHGRQAAEALDHAHGRGILHRDIKPANLMLDVEGHLWVTDFGLAQIQGDSRLTLTGDLLGTLRYMSPEQALGQAGGDRRPDRHLLAGRDALRAADAAARLRRRRPRRDPPQDRPGRADAAPAGSTRPCPGTWRRSSSRRWPRSPSERYATARELADDLGRFLDARPIAARPPGPAGAAREMGATQPGRRGPGRAVRGPGPGRARRRA